MSTTMNIKGTSLNTFAVGKNKLKIDASNLTTERTLTFPNSNGTSGQVLATNGSGNLTWTSFQPVDAYILVRNEQTSGTAGGTTTTGNNTVPFNTVTYNSISGVTLSSNIITGLPAGTYRFSVRQPVGVSTGAQSNQLIVYNNTSSTNLFICDSISFNSSGRGIPTTVPGSGVFTLAGTTDISIILWVAAGIATTGFGTATSSGNGEVYGTLEIWKIL